MMLLVAAPIILPLASAVFMMLLIGRWRLQGWVNLLASLLQSALAVALLLGVRAHGPLIIQAGGWPAPFGITLSADLLSAVMVGASALIGLCTALFSLATIDGERIRHYYYPLVQVLLMGVNGAFLTADVFNLYVWFEVMLISSFVLLVLGGSAPQLEGAIKYVTINLLSSAVFLAAVGILYGMAGTLNMADLALRIPLLGHRDLLSVVAVLFMLTFGVKAAMFPLFFWLPASYHTPPIAVSALFAGLLTKVGVYAMMRFFTTIFTGDAAGFVHELLLVLSVFTMVVGVLGAAAQYDLRKLLSFHIVSQIGYMLFAVAIQSPLAIAGGIVYIVHNILAKTALFYVGGIARRAGGSFNLRHLGGLYRSHPLLSGLFIVAGLALAGLPPLSGFWAKLTLIRAGLEAGHYLPTAAALGVSLLTLFSMTKIWNEAFWKEAPADGANEAPCASGAVAPRLLYTPALLLVAFIIAFGLGFEPVFELATRAAGELLDTAAYSGRILGGMP